MNPKAKTGAVFDFFFIRSVPAVIWILLLAVFGFAGYRSMIKESLPDLEIPEFYVTTIWDGATPAMVEKEVTQKIEKELRGIKGLKKLFSSSMHGISIVAVSFEAERDLSESMQLLERDLGAAQGKLPKGAERPKVEASSVNDAPIATIALFGDVDRSALESLAETVKRRLERIHGLRKINTSGAREEVVQVGLLPQRLKEAGLSATLVRERIISQGMDAPWGGFERSDLAFTMKMDGAYDDLEDLRELVIARLGGGRLARLKDVAEVRMGHMREKTRAALSWNGGEYAPVVALDLLKAPGQDTLALVEEITKRMEEASASELWPSGVKWRLAGNEAEAIKVELKRGFGNGWQAMLAVFLVLFVLLTWREALVAAVSIPLTLFGAMALLWCMGYTFNLLVIVGMILALGLLVDDFILIMEGMHEGIFIKGLGFADSVKHTIRTYAVPSFSGSITTILVFAPLAFIGGVDGKFIRVIPVTAAVCLGMSYIVSVLLGPPFLRFVLGAAKGNDKKYGPGVIDRLSSKTEKRLAAWLGNAVVSSRKRALCWCLGALALFVLSLFAAGGLRDTLYPKEDGRTLGITLELADDATLEDSTRVGERVGAILRGKPYFQHVLRVAGAKDAYSLSSIHDYLGRIEAPNLVGFACFLVPGTMREKLAFEYAKPLRAEMENALRAETGAQVFINPAIGGSSSEDAVQIDISGEDMERLREIVQEVKLLLEQVPGVVDVRDSIGPAGTELRFRPMQEALDFYQVSQAELAGQMVAYMENEKIARYRRAGVRDDLDIRLGTRWDRAAKPEGPLKDWKELEKLAIINEQGQPVPLWSLAEPEATASQRVILRKEGRRSVTALAKLDGAYLSEVITRMRPKMEALQRGWPAGYAYDFAGEKDQSRTYRNMLLAFCVAIALVYAVLALLFDSMLYPGIILSTVLFSLVGVFFGFMLGGIPFSFSASIGIVALVGIVVNDAIIMVETMRSHRKRGHDVFHSAKMGAADRLRPIVSTTVTNFAGLAPLALSDPGWAPLCQAIIFGELSATVGAVLLIPALFVLLTRESKKAS
jgi:multidrug efflux pump subunit AcrB